MSVSGINTSGQWLTPGYPLCLTSKYLLTPDLEKETIITSNNPAPAIKCPIETGGSQTLSVGTETLPAFRSPCALIQCPSSHQSNSPKSCKRIFFAHSQNLDIEIRTCPNPHIQQCSNLSGGVLKRSNAHANARREKMSLCREQKTGCAGCSQQPLLLYCPGPVPEGIASWGRITHGTDWASWGSKMKSCFCILNTQVWEQVQIYHLLKYWKLSFFEIQSNCMSFGCCMAAEKYGSWGSLLLATEQT